MEKANDIIAGKDRPIPEQYEPGRHLKQEPSQKRFSTYLCKENKIYSLLILGLVTLEFFIFKAFYPYPDFFSDSYSYIYAAYAHLNVNIWPIGYSKFLMIFHWFTHSAMALNLFQYLFLEISGLYLYHTIVYFYPTGKNTRIILCLFLFFNPLNLYLANYVSSDSIFVGLSMIWLAQLIWIIQRSKWHYVIIQAFVIFIAFTFRYNAMYYPILSAMAIFMSKQKIWLKIGGSLLAPLLFAAFILFSREASFKMLGTAQFPPILGGWQWGNNALYMREYIDVDSTKFPTPETAELDQIARQYYRTIPSQYRELSSYVANFFIRQPEAPLKQYMFKHYQFKDEMAQVIAWGKVAPVFGEYGLHLIKSHPIAFARYYLLLNTTNYFLPPLEKLEVYNLGEDRISNIASFWFQFSGTKVTSISSNLQGYILFLYPSLFLFLNLYFIWNLLHFIRKRPFQKSEGHFSFTIALISSFMLLNFGFSIFANIIVIRYQVFPMIVCLGFSMLLTDYIEVTGKDDAKVIKEASSESSSPAMHPEI